MADTSGNKLVFRNLVDFILEHMPATTPGLGPK
jgi:hypothetical protein